MNDIWQPQFSILSMFLLTYAKYHLANPIFIGAEEGGGSPRSKNLRASSYVEPAPFPRRACPPPKRFEDFGRGQARKKQKEEQKLGGTFLSFYQIWSILAKKNTAGATFSNLKLL